jgi:hypothetical protein
VLEVDEVVVRRDDQGSAADAAELTRPRIFVRGASELCRHDREVLHPVRRHLATLVELTDEGERQLDRFLAILLEEAIDPLFSDWPAERQQAALEVLNSLANTLEDAE